LCVGYVRRLDVNHTTQLVQLLRVLLHLHPLRLEIFTAANQRGRLSGHIVYLAVDSLALVLERGLLRSVAGLQLRLRARNLGEFLFACLVLARYRLS
jgi:hypothetical protein